jgi:hypothetical protein
MWRKISSLSFEKQFLDINPTYLRGKLNADRIANKSKINDRRSFKCKKTKTKNNELKILQLLLNKAGSNKAVIYFITVLEPAKHCSNRLQLYINSDIYFYHRLLFNWIISRSTSVYRHWHRNCFNSRYNNYSPKNFLL